MKQRTALIVLSVLLLQSICGAGFALTIPAEQAQVKTVGAGRDGVWNLWSNGELADFVRIPKPGTYRIRVVCFGSPADGVWPQMALTIDSTAVESVTVATNKPAEYVFTRTVDKGDCRIGVSFLNDALAATEDRNLYIVSLSVVPNGNAPEPTLISRQKWQARWAEKQRKLEETTLVRAAKAIDKHRKSDAALHVTDKDGHPVAKADLSVELVRHDFLFGCNIYMFDRFGTARENDLYKERFRELFNYATTGFYWRSYEQQPGKPNYDHTDKVVAWCERNSIRVKGHPLLWACEHGIPRWSAGQPPPEARKKRVTDIMTRYAGKIAAWEVVNEPAHLPGLSIDDPYRWARETSPDAYLIANDYSVMANGCPAFFALLQKAVSNGVPFDGIGIQAHEPRTLRFPLDHVWKVLDRYAALGKELHITEFTPASGGQEITGSHVTGTWDEAAQADYATRFYTVCFAHPAVAAITWWDLSDAGSWLDGGGLLRKDLSPKPAYMALKKLIHEQWTSRANGRTDKSGHFSFRGFRGTYVARITKDGKVVEQAFHVGMGDRNPINIVLGDESTAAPATLTSRPPVWAQPLTVEGVPNLHKITDSLYRSAQPTATGMENLKAVGIKTVMNLRSFHTDRDDVGKTGLQQDRISMTAWHPEFEDAVRFLKVVTDPEQAPVLFHCRHGADRTGTMCAVYRIAVQGWTKEAAIREMTQGGYGFHEIWINLPKWIMALDIEKLKKAAGIADDRKR